MKNIVICCDGTKNKYDNPEKNTNVVKLFERLEADGAKQISFYHPGVGTYSSLQSNFRHWLRESWSPFPVPA